MERPRTSDLLKISSGDDFNEEEEQQRLDQQEKAQADADAKAEMNMLMRKLQDKPQDDDMGEQAPGEFSDLEDRVQRLQEKPPGDYQSEMIQSILMKLESMDNKLNMIVENMKPKQAQSKKKRTKKKGKKKKKP